MDQAQSSSLTTLGVAATLISAVGTAVNLFLRNRTRERLAGLRGASEETRARLLADAVVMFPVDTSGLSPEQLYGLVVAQLRDRDRHRSRAFWLGLALVFVLGCTTVGMSVAERFFQGPREVQTPAIDSAPEKETDPVPPSPQGTTYNVQQNSGDNGVNSVGNNTNIGQVARPAASRNDAADAHVQD